MSCQTDSPCSVTLTSAPSPDKRVRYGLGMLLGVADFEQEQAWFLAQDRDHARALHGCGVVCGLGVAADGGVGNIRIKVAAGLAVDGLGRMIRVPSEQCADLNAWLALPANQKAIGAGGAKTLHVVLHYCECATDLQPVPGQPCRTAEESQTATRITASFSLDLDLQAPNCPEEAATVRFGRWLRRLRVGAGNPTLDAAAIAAELATLADPAAPEVNLDTLLYLPAAQAETLLRHALVLWARLVRPAMGCAGEAGHGAGVALASIGFTLAADFTASDVKLLATDPPVLLSTRLIQEALLNLAGQVAEVQAGNSVQPLVFGAAGVAGSDAAYSRADHVHALPPLPAPADLAGDVAGNPGANLVANLQKIPLKAEAPKADEVLTFKAGAWQPAPLPAAPALPDLAGDVAGNPGANLIANLQKNPVKADAPKAGEVLTFKDGVWQPLPVPAGTGDSAPKDVVLRPPGLPDYAIVAAGVIASGRSLGPVYNKLAGKAAGDGLLLLSFEGYKQPSARTRFALLIKALPVRHKEFPALSVALASFEADGFVLEILSNSKPVLASVLDQVFVHVEVSQYSA